MDPNLAPVAAVVRPAEELATLAAQINAAHEAGEAATRRGLEHFRAAGEALLRAKAQCGHGNWLPWVKKNLRCSDRQARRYMRLAKSDVTSDLAEQWRTILGNDADDGSAERSTDPAATDLGADLQRQLAHLQATLWRHLPLFRESITEHMDNEAQIEANVILEAARAACDSVSGLLDHPHRTAQELSLIRDIGEAAQMASAEVKIRSERRLGQLLRVPQESPPPADKDGVAFDGKDILAFGFRLTPTGLQEADPANKPTFEQWQQMGRLLAQLAAITEGFAR